MKGKQTALYPGNEDKVGYWLTPKPLMDELQAEFDFNYDACPYPRPAGFDGLKEDWGTRTYCNPPFRGGVVAWARKAIQEYTAGKLVVLIVPVNRIDHIVEPLLDVNAEYRLIRPVAWRDERGRVTKRPAACILFILRGKP